MVCALPEIRAPGGPLMCPRTVYVAPSLGPLLLVQGAFGASVFLTWKATGTSTVLCAAAGVAASASTRPLQIRPARAEARRLRATNGALRPFEGPMMAPNAIGGCLLGSPMIDMPLLLCV